MLDSKRAIVSPRNASTVAFDEGVLSIFNSALVVLNSGFGSTRAFLDSRIRHLETLRYRTNEMET